MGLKIDNGVLLSPDANGNYIERAAFSTDGDLVFKNADGTSKGAGITESAGDARYLQLIGGTVTGAFHANHTSNTFTASSVTVSKGSNAHAYFYVSRTNYEAGIQFQTSGTTKWWLYMPTGNDNLIAFYHSGSNRFTVDNSGNAQASGNLYASGGNSTQWNTAYGWGNHAGLYAAASHTHAYLPLAGGTLGGDLRFNQGSGYGRIAYVDNYHGMVLRGYPNNATGSITVGDVTSLIQHSGDFRFYRTNGSINELYFQVNSTAAYHRGNQIWDTSDFTSTNVSNWNTAYGWGNHAGLYAAASHTHSYLPLSGGTLTGAVTAPEYYINNASTKLTEGSGDSLRIQTGTGYVDIGSMNSGWVHFQADRAVYMWANGSAFSFDADVTPYNNTKSLGTSAARWSTVYGTNGDFSGALYVGTTNVDPSGVSGFAAGNISESTTGFSAPGIAIGSTTGQHGAIVYGSNQMYFGTENGSDNTLNTRMTLNSSGTLNVTGNITIGGANVATQAWASSQFAASAHTHDDRYYTETEVNTLLAGKASSSHTHNVYDLNNYYSSADPNTTSQTRIWTSLNGGTVGNYPSAYNGVVNLGIDASHGLQFSYHYGATDDALWFRHKSDNPSAPSGSGWQGWKRIASTAWVQAQGYLTNASVGNYATQQDITNAINNLIDSSPGTLDTLNELAAAINDDPNFYQTVNNKLSLSGGTLSGGLNMGNNDITGVNNIVINGPGPSEGIAWNNGNGWNIWESPDDLVTNSAGNLQFVRSGTRVMTLDTSNHMNVTGNVKAYGFQGNANVGGTGAASYHPSGIYSANYNWLYGGGNFNGGDWSNMGNLRTVDSNDGFWARYNAGDDNYAATLFWNTLQLGNNGQNILYVGKTNTGGYLDIYTNVTGQRSTTGANHAMRIQSNGRVSIGTTTDSGYALTVSGGIYNDTWYRVTGSTGYYFETHGGGWHMSDGTYLRVYNSKTVYNASGAFRSDASDQAFQVWGTANWYLIDFGNRSASAGRFGIGLTAGESNRTLSFHVPNHAAYSSSGNIPKFGWYSNGSDELMTLQSATGNLWTKGTITSSGLVTGTDVVSTNGVFASSADGGRDCYMAIGDDNPTEYGGTYGGTFRFYGDTSQSASVLYAGGGTFSGHLAAPAIYGTTTYFGADSSHGYAEAFGSVGSGLRRISYITMNNGSSNWNDSFYHGIQSTDSGGSYSDSISINSYNDITLRLDTNNNNGASYLRITNNTSSTGGNTIAYIGHDGSTNVSWFSGVVTAGNDFRAPIFYDSADTNYYVDPNSDSRLRHLYIGDVAGSNDGSWNARMKVIGSAHARLDVVSNSDGIITTMFSHIGQGAGKVGTYSNHPLKLVINGNDKATLDSSGNFTVTGRFTEQSSIRFKTNVQDLGPTLSKVEQLRGVTYTKDTNDQIEIGMIAEEVGKLFPELVSTDENGVVEALNYSRVTAVLVEAVKELSAKVQAQEIFIDNIVSRLERLENK